MRSLVVEIPRLAPSQTTLISSRDPALAPTLLLQRRRTNRGTPESARSFAIASHSLMNRLEQSRQCEARHEHSLRVRAIGRLTHSMSTVYETDSSRAIHVRWLGPRIALAYFIAVTSSYCSTSCGFIAVCTLRFARHRCSHPLYKHDARSDPDDARVAPCQAPEREGVHGAAICSLARWLRLLVHELHDQEQFGAIVERRNGVAHRLRSWSSPSLHSLIDAWCSDRSQGRVAGRVLALPRVCARATRSEQANSRVADPRDAGARDPCLCSAWSHRCRRCDRNSGRRRYVLRRDGSSTDKHLDGGLASCIAELCSRRVCCNHRAALGHRPRRAYSL